MKWRAVMRYVTSLSGTQSWPKALRFVVGETLLVFGQQHAGTRVNTFAASNTFLTKAGQSRKASIKA
jgi:hypothetical protein